jgi:hypothetical protein
LNGYGWVNKEQGIVRIPIERAMELIVEKGFPGAAPKTAAGKTAAGKKGGQ